MSKHQYIPASADALARIHTAEAVGFLVQAMRGEIEGIKPGERLRAAEGVIERGHGKAVQATISVPARQAYAQKLLSLSSDELLAIALGGSTPPNGGPMAGSNSDGTIQATGHRKSLRQEIIDAEYDDLYDPTA
jgi:hypothetical protein